MSVVQNVRDEEADAEPRSENRRGPPSVRQFADIEIAEIQRAAVMLKLDLIRAGKRRAT